MDDLISRRVAIDAFYAQSDDDGWWMGTVEDFERFINGLPTAQRQIENAYKEGYFDCQQEWLRQKETHLTSIEINEGGIVGKFTERKWIPVTERLPEANQYDEKNVAIYHLVQTEYGDMMVATYRGSMGNKWWEQIFSLDVIEDKVVAWMPLPEPWKGEDE